MTKEMIIKELKEQRNKLVKQQQKEYQTRGNTQRCQELWAEIEKIDAQLEQIRKDDDHDKGNGK